MCLWLNFKEYQLDSHVFCMADIVVVHVQTVVRNFSITSVRMIVLSSDKCQFFQPRLNVGLFLSELFSV